MVRMARCCGLVLAGLASPLAAQIPPPADPAVCAQKDGFVLVAKDFINALATAGQSGQIDATQYQKLATWFIAMQNWMVETNLVQQTCEALLKTRRDNGF